MKLCEFRVWLRFYRHVKGNARRLGPVGQLRCRLNCALGVSKAYGRKAAQRKYIRELTAHLHTESGRERAKQLLRTYRGIKGAKLMLALAKIGALV